VSLLDPSAHAELIGLTDGDQDILRARDESAWRRVVLELMEVCPRIVMDTRDVTTYTAYEASLIIAEGHLGKTTFLATPGGETPLLNHLACIRSDLPDRVGFRIVAERDLVHRFSD